jgi:hypothetical protein
MEFIMAMGIPSAITGLLVWWLKKYIDKRDAEAAEREQNTEKLMLMIMQTSRANNILAEATARAVQRIPDAHCNGDMKTALERAAEIQKAEQQFLIDQGVKHIFGTN